MNQSSFFSSANTVFLIVPCKRRITAVHDRYVPRLTSYFASIDPTRPLFLLTGLARLVSLPDPSRYLWASTLAR